MAETGYEVVVERWIKCDPARSWAAWTEPSELDKWFTTGAELDLSVGGRYRNNDNDSGEFLAIEEPRFLSFTWEQPQHAAGSIVDVELRQEPNEMRIKLRHHNLSTEKDGADLKIGWSWAMDSLKSYLETGRAIRYDDWASAQKA